jgi:hypothetical protein
MLLEECLQAADACSLGWVCPLQHIPSSLVELLGQAGLGDQPFLQHMRQNTACAAFCMYTMQLPWTPVKMQSGYPRTVQH